MATHDYVIDNSTGANVRADINNVLQAILTNNSSSSAPSTTAAYMWWADTTNGVLKIRNSANNAWVELLQLDGTLTLEDGSASTPALAFRDDLNTGIFSSAADRFNVATAGVERMELGSTLTVFNEDGADTDFRIESDTNENMFKIDAGTSRIAIGHGTPTSILHTKVTGADNRLTLETATSGNPEIMFNAAGAGGHIIGFDRGNAALTFTVAGGSERMRIDSTGRVLIGQTTSDDSTSMLQVKRANNSTIRVASSDATATNFAAIDFAPANSVQGAAIICVADGTFSGSSNQSAHLRFITRNSGTDSEAMRIDSSGNLGIGMTPSGMRLDVQSATNDIARFTGTNSGGITFRNDTSNEIQIHSGNSDALIFGTNGENERMRIDSGGHFFFSTTSQGVAGGHFNIDGSGTSRNAFSVKGTTGNYVMVSDAGGTTGDHINFRNYNGGDNETGKIQDNGSNVTYNTSSDYRIKENIVSISDGIIRLKQLNPIRHTFKNNSNAGTVDGWLAHELDEVCSYAVTGKKDAVNEDGTPNLQAVDYGRITPLLAAALKETISKIEVLETKVAALEAA